MSKIFFEEIDGVFKNILDTDKGKIIIVDATTEQPIVGVKYDKMLFDTELNMYKINSDGKITSITNPKVKAIIKQ